MKNSILAIIRNIGDDPDRKELEGTPDRILKSYKELFSGYDKDPIKLVKDSCSDSNGYTEMIIVDNIQLYSHCEHHMAPMIGKVHIAYIPDKKIAGLSKIIKLADIYARRLQMQERLTKEIAEGLKNGAEAYGVAVALEMEHFCIKARGIKQENSFMKTKCFLGSFKDDVNLRNEFLATIKSS